MIPAEKLDIVAVIGYSEGKLKRNKTRANDLQKVQGYRYNTNIDNVTTKHTAMQSKI